MARARTDLFSLAWKLAELAWATPTIVATRLYAPPSSPKGRQAETRRMVSEKISAFQQAGLAMSTAAATAWIACPVAWPYSAAAWSRAANAGIKICSAGLQPVHRTAMANHRRLTRKPPSSR